MHEGNRKVLTLSEKASTVYGLISPMKIIRAYVAIRR